MSSILRRFSGSTRRVTFGLSVIQLIKAFLQFFTVIISSAYFGTSLGRDVWLLSLSIVSILGAVTFGPVFEIFRAKYVRIKETTGEYAAIQSAGSVMGYILAISFFIVLVSELVPSILGKSFAPTFSADQHKELSIMIRFIVPTLLFSVITSILSALLNIYRIFYIPEMMNIFSSILNVIIVIAFAPSLGIYSLVISGYLSNIILIFILIMAIRKGRIPLLQNLNLRFTLFLDYLRFALPFYFNYIVAQVLLAAEKIISTIIGVGSVSVLDYARKFVSIPISVIQSTVNVVLTSTLTQIHIREGDKGLINEVNNFMNMMILVTLPLVTLFVVCPHEIVRVFLLRGAFDPKFVDPTARSLFWFGFGIVSIIFYTTNSQALLSQGKNKTSALISGVMGFLVLFINLCFYNRFGIQVLAFSWSLVHFVAGIIMYFNISLSEYKRLLNNFSKETTLILIVTVVSSFLYFLLKNSINQTPSKVFDILILLVIILMAFLIEIFVIYLLHFEEWQIIKKHTNTIVNKVIN